MNLALFVTKESLPSLPALVARMASLQKDTVNGVLVVIHDSFIPVSALNFTLPLATKFKVRASLPVQVNASHSVAEQASSMFARFLTSAYTRYPGPWLLFDEPAEPKQENFMQALLKQHGAHGGKMTGRAITNPGSATPVGPVTLELDFKLLRFLRFPTRQSWRERGQFLFVRGGFQLIPAEDWLFTMRRPEPAEPKPEVEATQPNIISPHPDDLDSYSDEMLAQLLLDQTGKRPHHFTGRDKLLQMAKELTTQPA